jgi:hypothetical protein
VARFWLAVAPATGPSPNPWPAAKARRTAGPSNPRLTVWPLGLEYGPDANLAFVASLMADRHRAQMLLTLLGGTPQSGLRWARMCYDHLAGTVGVSLTEALIGRGLLRERDGAFLMGTAGAAEFGALGTALTKLRVAA